MLTQLQLAADVLDAMRRFVLSVIFALVVLLATTAASGARGLAAPTGCPPVHAHVLHADRQAVVFWIGEHYVETTEGLHGPTHVVVPIIGIRGCVRGHPRSYKLGGPRESEGGGAAQSFSGIGHEVLGGTMVAYEEFAGAANFEGLTEASWLVIVRDLRSGRLLHEVATGIGAKAQAGFAGVGRAAAIVVKRDGAVAWIAENYERSGRAKYFEVHAVDQMGSKLLAAGTGIDLRSFRLTGSTLAWKQRGQRFSSLLR